MTQRSRTALKAFFETGDKPTQQQFADLIDSVLNYTDDAPIGVFKIGSATVNLDSASETEIPLIDGTFVVSNVVIHSPIGTPDTASGLSIYPPAGAQGARVCYSINNIELLTLLDQPTRQLSFSVLDKSENIDVVTGSVYAVLDAVNGETFNVQVDIYGYKLPA